MKAALFFEDNQLCHIDENIKGKAIKVSTITTDEDKVVSIKNKEIKNRNVSYFVSWLLACGIKMIYVSGIDEKLKSFFERMEIIVNVKGKSDKPFLLTEMTSKG